MKIRMWMGINAWVSFVTGLGFLLVPAQALQILGGTTDAVGLAAARFFGVTEFLVGLILWMTRSVEEPHYFRRLAGAVFVADVVAVIIAVRETLAGTINWMGWGIAALYFLFAVTFGFSLLRITEPVSVP